MRWEKGTRYKGGTRPGLSSEEAYVTKSEYKEEKSKWDMVRKVFTHKERNMLIAKMFEIAVRECFRNHVYQFDGRYYVQKEGGAIGLCLTGVVAEINMAAWEGKFRDLVKKNEIDLIMSDIYVDDQNVLFKIIKRGTRGDSTCLSWRQEWLKEEDVRNDGKQYQEGYTDGGRCCQ